MDNKNENSGNFRLKNNKIFRRVLLVFLSVILAFLLVFAGYIIYLLVDYHRIPDKQPLAVSRVSEAEVKTGEKYRVLSYNIGFAAYTPDFGFFMDGGKESRAASLESVNRTLEGIIGTVKDTASDFILIEEVDKKATRSYYVDQKKILENGLSGYNSVFAVNFDSSYLFYPFNRPHGKSLAGMMTLSKYNITESLRRSFPIEKSVMKIVDLDRCYTVSRIPVQNGKELVLYTVHLSAYTSDGKIADEQFEMLLADMQSEYEKGNYTVCGGDFNKDILGNSGEIFGISNEGYTWAQPLKTEFLKGRNLSIVKPFDSKKPVPSCRNADGPYSSSQFVITVDGFIVSQNIEVCESNVVDTGFEYSDHNPVFMDFKLK